MKTFPYSLIVKYLDQKTLIIALKSRSKLTLAALWRIQKIQLPKSKTYINNNMYLLPFLSEDQISTILFGTNSEILIARLINQYHSIINWNEVLDWAWYGGHSNTAKLAISHGANDLNRGLGSGCHSRNIKIVNWMIAKGAEKCEWCGTPSEKHQDKFIPRLV